MSAVAHTKHCECVEMFGDPAHNAARVLELEERIEYEQGASHMLGISSGWEETASYVRTKAADYFRGGKDREANLLRDLSDELAKIQTQRRKAFDDHEAEYNADAQSGLENVKE